MPGPKTHQIFYNQLKQHLHKDTLDRFPNYDEYSIFVQGHDLLIYHDFYKIWNSRKLERNVHYSELLQEFYFPEFIYSYIKYAEEIGVLHNEQICLFLAGYIGHHVLDAYTHPLIIYYSGDHIRNRNNATWKHGIVENLIDIYLMETQEQKNPKTYRIYKDFAFSHSKICIELKEVLNNSLNEIYNFENGGSSFEKAFLQLEWFMRIFKYDHSGIKRRIFDLLDPITKGTSSFSYNRSTDGVKELLNEAHKQWCNPMNGQYSDKSFMDLYKSALSDTADIINRLVDLFDNHTLSKDDVFNIIPNIASTHGLKCGQKLKINYTRQQGG